MSERYARLLGDQDLVEHFLDKVLDHDFSNLKNIHAKIIQGEIGLLSFDINKQTLNATNYRHRDYKDDRKRSGLRKHIIDELVNNVRPDDDDAIKLGYGGVLPKSGLANHRQAHIIIGLPASGKSGIANKCAESNNAIIIDSDYAKRKLPEYDSYPWGASITHEESSEITNGFSNNPQGLQSIFELAILKNANIVIPKIGQKAEGIIKLARAIKSRGYQVHLTLVSLLKREATIRAVYRYYKTQRYVPLGLIFDSYGNDPCLTYYLIKNKYFDLFDSFGAVSTNMPMGENPFCIDASNERNIANIFELNKNILY